MRRFVGAMAMLAGTMLAVTVAHADELAVDLGSFNLSTSLTAGGVANRNPTEFGSEPEQLTLSTSLKHELTGANLTVGGGVVGRDLAVDAFTADPVTRSGDRGGYQAFAELGIAGFTIGGGYAMHYDETVVASEPKRQSYNVGASYALEDWTFGLDWARGDYDEVFLDLGAAGSGDIVAFTTSYALRPNIRLNGLLEYSDTEAAGSRSEAGAIAVGIGTLIKF